MPKRIRVENMTVTTTPAQVLAGFDNFGSITRCQLEFDDEGASTGVAHVEFASTQAGAAAIASMNEKPFNGATIRVREDA
ncbi:RNA recognition motif domain-containing protein [Nannocystis bainbridge]|uniref:RNA-binding protein n=1 Tax=Nannocystis bainbridge TaxID=2995303 RepID=A0ABT5DXV0_9BACT|nr:RNA-binding protein [Nannocystis bainbridge]MDC0718437.1 RNA-binding protein [Nannocystis bainbridge]